MKPIVILDRDGTVNEEVNYLSRPDQVVLCEGAAEGIRLLMEIGLPVVLITNQSGLGRRFFNEATLAQIHEELRLQLASQGARLDKIYYCPHLPSDGCDCRKPAPALARRAAQDFGADLTCSFVVGDKKCDMDLGSAIGAQRILVRTGYGAQASIEESAFDFCALNLREAASHIRSVLTGRGYEKVTV